MVVQVERDGADRRLDFLKCCLVGMFDRYVSSEIRIRDCGMGATDFENCCGDGK